MNKKEKFFSDFKKSLIYSTIIGIIVLVILLNRDDSPKSEIRDTPSSQYELLESIDEKAFEGWIKCLSNHAKEHMQDQLICGDDYDCKQKIIKRNGEDALRVCGELEDLPNK